MYVRLVAKTCRNVFPLFSQLKQCNMSMFEDLKFRYILIEDATIVFQKLNSEEVIAICYQI